MNNVPVNPTASPPLRPNEHDNLYYDQLQQGFDLKSIVSAFYRSRYWIVGILITCLVLGMALSLLSSRVYRALATVQIEQEAQKVLGTEDQINNSLFDSNRFLQTQLDIVRSRNLTVKVAESLNLFGNQKFYDAIGAEPAERPSGDTTLEDTRKSQVIRELQDRMGATLPMDSRLASITFEAQNPRMATEIANSYAENYIQGNLERKFKASAYARQFLKEQLDEAAGQLADDERAVLRYAASSQILDVSNGQTDASGDEGPKSLSTVTLVRLNEELSSAVAKRIAAEQKWRAARNTPSNQLASILENSAIQQLQGERAKVEAEYQDQLAVRKDDFPTVRRTKARLDELNQQIENISSSVKASIKSEYDAARLEEMAFQQKIDQLKSATIEEQGKAVRLGILQRQARTTRELYDLLLTRYNELNASAGVQANNLAIVDLATLPTRPISPNIPLNMVLALVFGFVLSAMFVFVREQLFDVIRLPVDVEDKLRRPLIGTIPLSSLDPEDFRAQFSDLKSPASEAFSSVRTKLLLSSSSGLPRSLMMTSSTQGEGKSSSCLGLAISLARAGQKVLVVDLDLRRPQQHRNFGVKNQFGMSDVLSQNKSIDEVIVKTDIEGVDFIPSGGIPPNPTELMSGDISKRVLESLVQRYDIVIADCPPILGLSDALLISNYVDQTIFVVESGRVQTHVINQALGRLSASGEKIAGVLLTKFNAKEAGYGASGYYEYNYNED
jgi:succinoglycan biosynthesis transport protein ExoP